MAKARIIAAAALLMVGPAAALAGSGEYQNLNAMGLASEKAIFTGSMKGRRIASVMRTPSRSS
jgi:hypothetical protein